MKLWEQSAAFIRFLCSNLGMRHTVITDMWMDNHSIKKQITFNAEVLIWDLLHLRPSSVQEGKNLKVFPEHAFPVWEDTPHTNTTPFCILQIVSFLFLVEFCECTVWILLVNWLHKNDLKLLLKDDSGFVVTAVHVMCMFIITCILFSISLQCHLVAS